MSTTSCPQETKIVEAARTGRLDESAKTHMESCAHCREVAGIAEWMTESARMDAGNAVLPEPGQVYLGARIAAMEEAGEKALRPLVIAEAAIRITVILALACGILWAWFGFRTLAGSFLPGHLRLPQPVLISAAALATGLIALLFTRLVQPILIEE